MYGKFQQYLKDELAAIEAAGLYKKERNIASPQYSEITLEDGSKALNFCANNYLGLANSERLALAAEKAMKEEASECLPYVLFAVRRICINNWKKRYPLSFIRKTLSFMLLVLMQTEGYSNRS